MLAWDRGTLVLPPHAEGPDPSGLPGVLWDPRTSCWRAPAWRYAELAACTGAALVDLRGAPWPAPALRPYQEAAVLAWERARRRGQVVLPTGAGKTRTAVAAIARAGVSTLCVVPTRVLVEPWRMALAEAGAGPVGRLADGVRDLQRITVATTASARIHARHLGAGFALIVVDEVHHHAGSDETLELYAAPLRLGLTATPPEEPAPQARLARLVGPVVARIGIDDLAGTWLAPYDLVERAVDLDPRAAAAYRAEVEAFRAVHGPWWRTAADRSWAAFVRAATRSEEGRRALGAWRRSRERVAWHHGKDAALAELLEAHRAERVLVFTRDNAVAYAITRAHLVAPLTCDIGKDERTELLRRFASGELRALVSSRVLNEGVDVPSAEVAVLCGGSQGAREYVQRVGRILRPHPGKRALVVELVTRGTHEVGASERHRRRLAPG